MTHTHKIPLRQTIFLILLLGAFTFTFLPVWQSLLSTWMNSDDYSHGFFMLPLALFICWQKKNKLLALPVQTSWTGLVLSILALLIFLVGHFGRILTLQPLSMLLFMAGSLLFLFGFRVFRELLFPLFLLLFMIPVPSQIVSAATINLQLFISAVSSEIVTFFGVSLYREGNVLHLPEQTLQVVRACSGMRSLISLLALSAVFGYFTLRSNILRTFLFVSGFPIAVLVNIVRVVLMICFLTFFDIDLTHGTVHTVFGLSIFLLALALLFVIKELLIRWDTPSQAD